jgi:hypothetical protein
MSRVLHDGLADDFVSPRRFCLEDSTRRPGEGWLKGTACYRRVYGCGAIVYWVVLVAKIGLLPREKPE